MCESAIESRERRIKISICLFFFVDYSSFSKYVKKRQIIDEILSLSWSHFIREKLTAYLFVILRKKIFLIDSCIFFSLASNMVSSSVYHQIVTILCLIGISLSLYAFYVETRKTQDPTYRAACDIGERMSCSRVLTSRWGRGFGLLPSDSILNLPDSIFGLIYYCLSLLLNRSFRSDTIARLRVVLSILTNLGSVYLGYILYFILEDICFVCCGMYLANFLLLICNFKLLTSKNTSPNKQKKKQQ